MMMSFSTDPISLLVLFLIIILVWITVKHYRAPCKNFPPGPWGLPIIGSFIYFGKHAPYKDMMRLSKQYGDVYSLKMGSRIVVVVSGTDAIKECLVQKGNDFADRPYLWVIDQMNPKYDGIVHGHFDDKWQRRRQFAHTTLRGFGFGKTEMESKVAEEILFLLDEFRNIQGKPVNTDSVINRSVSNVICSVAFGKRFDYSDPILGFMIDIMGKWFESSRKMLELDVLPFLRPFNKQLIDNFSTFANEVKKFCMQQIDEHREAFDENNIGDFIDAYLAEATKEHSKEDFTDNHLAQTLVDLFSAGTETTATTLRWGLLFMVLHPKIQQLVFNEIDQVVGPNRLPRLADRTYLPYTEATLCEIQRLGSITPIILPHAALVDSTLGGYDIPKGTEISIILWSMHLDPHAWPNPDEFDPNRFYDQKTNALKKNENFMPFSAGRRVCMGEQLAKHELFLYFSAMINQFKFSLPVGTKKPSTDGVFGLTLVPRPYQVVIEERNI
ncbi:cytochrome P450 2U1-like [Saccoglossus kowalevskii]|uniref:Cytochrome P450 2U1-like n=1 Tax=Saccoglossus kowalevskii TaxID=10224 RepID=A0ABM0MUS6_SACKO|nr:PREDICTED: cytochrome P450 2U1-like [Saccoglossus kowalevskii]